MPELKHGHATRGKGTSRTYNAWSHMLQRCNNTSNARYKDYGGRGIQVTKEWFTFANFLRDMGESPGTNYVLDRTNNNGDYTPENCRWVTYSESAQNKRQYKNNTSGVTGVSFVSTRNYWMAYVNENGKRKWIGRFKTREEAIEARSNYVSSC